MDLMRINVGCGTSPTPDWTNFDNSWTVRLAPYPHSKRVLGLLAPSSIRFAEIASQKKIRWADAVRRIPVPDSVARVLYSSHMLEHLDPEEAKGFLKEARRVLIPGGVLRLAVPDLSLLARRYAADGDADAFVNATLLADAKPRTLRERLKRAWIGGRHHYWMYDGKSLAYLLVRHGFHDAQVMSPGATMIPNPGNLDLHERVDESVYVEAKRA
jgi:hypothetical protein